MSIKKNVIYNSLLNVTNVIFPFITVPYISRILGPHGIGVSSFAIIYAGYFGTFAALGIPMYGIREVSKVRNDNVALGKIFSELFAINTISVFIFSLLYIVSIYIVPQLKDQINILFVAGFILYLSSFSIDWFFSGLEKFKIITMRSLIIKSLSLLGLFFFVRNTNDIIPYILLSVFAQLGNQIWNFIVLSKTRISVSFKKMNLKKHIKPLMILFTSVIAISIYTVLDTLMLGFLSNYEEVAYYSSAIKISRLILPIVTSLGTVLLPRFAYYKENNRYEEINNITKKSFSFVLLLALPITTALIIVAPQFVPVFFGPKFNGTILPMQILSLLVVIIGINNLSGVQILVGLGYDKIFMKSVIIGTIVNFVLNLFLIPRYGALGTSWASVIAETLIAVTTIYYASKCIKINIFSLKIFLKNLLPALSFFPLYWILELFGFSPWLLITLFFIIGFFIYSFSQYWYVKNVAFFLIVDMIKTKIRRL